MPGGVLRDEVRLTVMRLLRTRNTALCDACIERALGYEFKTVNPVNNEFMRDGQIRRGRGVCPVCQKSKLVNAIE